MCCLQSADSFGELVKNTAPVIGSIITASVAIYGINIWKAKQIGNDKYTVAKQLLLQILKIRERINDARNPWIGAGEQEIVILKYFHDLKEKPEYEISPTDRQKVISQCLIERWKLAFELLPEYESNKLGAEVVLKEELQALLKELESNISYFRAVVSQR